MTVRSGGRRIWAAALITCMLLPPGLSAQQAVDEDPNEFAMVGDLVVARPIGLVMTVGGTAVWLVSLPFTLMAGHASEAADTLILGPAKTTFVRCLGCRSPGYTGRDSEQSRKNQEKAEDAEAEADSDS